MYAGLTSDSEQEILRVDEVSDDWNRCCCTPYHPMKLEVRQYVPVPGDGTNSDYRHLMEDFRNDFTRYFPASMIITDILFYLINLD